MRDAVEIARKRFDDLCGDYEGKPCHHGTDCVCHINVLVIRATQRETLEAAANVVFMATGSGFLRDDVLALMPKETE